MFESAWEGLRGPGEKVLLAIQKNDYTKLAITYTEDSISLKKMEGEYAFNYPRYTVGLIVTGVVALTMPFGFVAAALWGVMYPMKKLVFDDFVESNCRPYVSFVASSGYKTQETYAVPGIGKFIEQHGKKSLTAETRNTLEANGIKEVPKMLVEKIERKNSEKNQVETAKILEIATLPTDKKRFPRIRQLLDMPKKSQKLLPPQKNRI